MADSARARFGRRLEFLRTRFSEIAVARWLVIFLLVSSGAAAVLSAARFLKSGDADYANAFAGASAVLAACISALVAFRAVEIAEQSQRPYPYPFIDTQSRYQLILLKLKNAGGTSAHDVFIEWDEGCRPNVHRSNGAVPTDFATGADKAVKLLLPGETLTSMLGVSFVIAKDVKESKNEWSGTVHFRDTKGHRLHHRFLIDRSVFSWGLADETEQLKAMYSVSQMPELLRDIKKSIDKIGKGA